MAFEVVTCFEGTVLSLAGLEGMQLAGVVVVGSLEGRGSGLDLPLKSSETKVRLLAKLGVAE